MPVLGLALMAATTIGETPALERGNAVLVVARTRILRPVRIAAGLVMTHPDAPQTLPPPKIRPCPGLDAPRCQLVVIDLP